MKYKIKLLFITILIATGSLMISENIMHAGTFDNGELKYFNSVDELKSWINDNKNTWDIDAPCWEIFENVADIAHMDGYRVYVIILRPEQFEYLYNQETNNWHAICITLIGKRLILFDQNKIWDYIGARINVKT